MSTTALEDLRIQGETARIIIVNCHSFLRRRFAGDVLWSFVSRITGHGSGYSIEICKSAGLDPHQLIIPNKGLQYLPEATP